MTTHQWVRRARLAPAMAALAAVGACGDSGTGPAAGALSPAESQALASALATAPPTSGFGSVAPVALGLVGNVGSVSMSPVLSARVAAAMAAARSTAVASAVAGSYRAIGVLVNLNIAPAGAPAEVTHVFGLFGWSGVNAAAHTVDNVLFVGGVGPSTLASSGAGFSAVLGGAGGGGGFITRVPNASYVGTGGTFAVSSWASSGGRSCSQTVAGAGNITCQVAMGLMTGSFSFVGAPASGPGGVTFPVTPFENVPLLVLTMSFAP